jgi:hypothetical protein
MRTTILKNDKYLVSNSHVCLSNSCSNYTEKHIMKNDVAVFRVLNTFENSINISQTVIMNCQVNVCIGIFFK